MRSVLEFQSKKAQGEAISMITCYDTWSAKIINDSSIDSILIGDSASMVMHGHPSTVHADTQMMAAHVSAVSKGAPNKFLIGDIPFLATVRAGQHSWILWKF